MCIHIYIYIYIHVGMSRDEHPAAEGGRREDVALHVQLLCLPNI